MCENLKHGNAIDAILNRRKGLLPMTTSDKAKNKSVFFRIVKKFTSLFYFSKTDIIFGRKLTDFSFPIEKLKSTANHRRITDADLGEIKEKFGVKKFDKFKEWLPKAVCIVPFDDSGIMGYTWYTRAEMKKEGVRPLLYDIAPTAGTVYVFSSYMLKDKRNYFVAEKNLLTAMYDAKQHGSDRVITTTNVNNDVVKLMCRRLGFEYLGKISYTRWLFFSRTDAADLNKMPLFLKQKQPLS